MVNSHFLNGESQIKTFQQIEEEYSKGLILRLLFREKSQLILVKEVVLNGIQEAHIKFSDCGQYFTVIIPSSPKHQAEDQIWYLQMCEKSSIHDILRGIEENRQKIHMVNQPPVVRNANSSFAEQSFRKPQKKKLGFIEEVIFDQQMRFIIGYGKKQFMLFNLE
jgi:hypothetical protein